MTNRKLKKKIRQAFTNATPDLAESIAVEALFSDVPKRKKDRPVEKPVRTPIQFRAIATLAASVLVVVILAGLITMTNPFAAPNETGNNGIPAAPSNTPPDKIQNSNPTLDWDNECTDAEIQSLKDLIYSTVDVPLAYEDAGITTSLCSWKGRQYYSVLLVHKDANPYYSSTNFYYFFVDKETSTVHPYATQDYDYVKYNSLPYIDPPLTNNNIFDYMFVLAYNKLCVAVVADYGTSGEFILVDVNTDEVLERDSLVGSSTVKLSVAQEYNFMAISSVAVDWNFKFVDGIPCYEVNYRRPVTVYTLFDATDGTILDRQDYSVPPVDPDNTSGPPIEDTTDPVFNITDEDALYIALKHAGLTEDEIEDYVIDVIGAYPARYEVILYDEEYKYLYYITAADGDILKVNRIFGGSLEYILDIIIDNSSVTEMAMEDPLLLGKEDIAVESVAYVTGSVTPVYYTVKLIHGNFRYSFVIAPQYGIIMDLTITNNNYIISTDDYYTDSIVTPLPDVDIDADSTDTIPIIPPDGKIGQENAIDAALRYAGLEKDQVEYLECSEGIDSDEVSAYYDVVFYYNGYKWHYYIGMYSPCLLNIEQIPIS